jgi:hypothetical protein
MIAQITIVKIAAPNYPEPEEQFRHPPHYGPPPMNNHSHPGPPGPGYEQPYNPPLLPAPQPYHEVRNWKIPKSSLVTIFFISASCAIF